MIGADHGATRHRRRPGGVRGLERVRQSRPASSAVRLSAADARENVGPRAALLTGDSCAARERKSADWWDDFWRRPLAATGRALTCRRTAEEALRLLAPELVGWRPDTELRVLDLGCGPRRPYAASARRPATGDRRAGSLGGGARRSSGARLERAACRERAERLALPGPVSTSCRSADGTFDVVVSFGYASAASYEGAEWEVARVLRPGRRGRGRLRQPEPVPLAGRAPADADAGSNGTVTRRRRSTTSGGAACASTSARPGSAGGDPLRERLPAAGAAGRAALERGAGSCGWRRWRDRCSAGCCWPACAGRRPSRSRQTHRQPVKSQPSGGR